jgi:hypothetical protein
MLWTVKRERILIETCEAAFDPLNFRFEQVAGVVEKIVHMGWEMGILAIALPSGLGLFQTPG